MEGRKNIIKEDIKMNVINCILGHAFTLCTGVIIGIVGGAVIVTAIDLYEPEESFNRHVDRIRESRKKIHENQN
jgi:uncharacterized membrane protein